MHDGVGGCQIKNASKLLKNMFCLQSPKGREDTIRSYASVLLIDLEETDNLVVPFRETKLGVI